MGPDHFQSLRNAYQLVMGELRRVEDSVQQQEFLGCGLPGPTVEFEQLIGHLCAQLCEFMRARQKTMDLYPSSYYLSLGM